MCFISASSLDFLELYFVIFQSFLLSLPPLSYILTHIIISFLPLTICISYIFLLSIKICLHISSFPDAFPTLTYILCLSLVYFQLFHHTGSTITPSYCGVQGFFFHLFPLIVLFFLLPLSYPILYFNCQMLAAISSCRYLYVYVCGHPCLNIA